MDKILAPDAIPIGRRGVEWGHHGNRCTFETIVSLHGIIDPLDLQIWRIIHEADITADIHKTLESAGVDDDD